MASILVSFQLMWNEFLVYIKLMVQNVIYGTAFV